MRLKLPNNDQFVTEIFFENRVIHVIDNCTVEQCVFAILHSLKVIGAAYLKDNEGILLPDRNLCTARGDVCLYVLSHQAKRAYPATKSLCWCPPPGNTVQFCFGGDPWMASTSTTAGWVLKNIVPFCTCTGTLVIYMSDQAGPVAPSLPLSSTIGQISLVIEKDNEFIECASGKFFN